MSELAQRGEKWARRNGRSPYPVMTTEDICALPVTEIARKNSLLLLWCTWPKLEDGLQVMAGWGYEYVSKAFVWVKLNPSGVGWHFGTGYHTHGNTEFVLLGKRGAGVKRRDAAVSELIIYPRGNHSAKPPVARDKIVRLYGDVSRCELFARQSHPEFAAWGNEVPFDARFGPLNDFLAPPYEAIVDEDEWRGLPVVDTRPGVYEPGEQMRLI